MRGAPQPGLLRLIIRIKPRISDGTLGRPGFPRLTFYVQNKLKPFRCQATTVSGLTIIRADSPLLPHTPQPDPEESIGWRQLQSFGSRTPKNSKLMTQGYVFES